MPYIKKEDREALNYYRSSKTPGELNFVITREVSEYIKNQGLSYQTINDIIGALEGAKMEFYRRVVTPYENTKLAENGDVFSL